MLINSPEAIASIQKVADLALVERVSPLNVIPEDNGVGIGSGTVAMITDGTWRLDVDFPNLYINYGIAPLPVIASFALSLFSWNGLGRMTFVGLDNYISLFTWETEFYGSLWTTVQYAGMSVMLSIVYAMIISLLLQRKILARGFFHAIFYLPYMLPAMAVYMDGKWLYDYNHLAGLQNVSPTHHEATEIDGANAWQRFCKITIPCMTPIIFYNLLMSLVSSLQVITPALSLTEGGPGTGSYDMCYMFDQQAFQSRKYGYGSAVALFILIAFFTAILFATSRNWTFYEGDDRE